MYYAIAIFLLITGVAIYSLCKISSDGDDAIYGDDQYKDWKDIAEDDDEFYK